MYATRQQHSNLESTPPQSTLFLKDSLNFVQVAKMIQLSGRCLTEMNKPAWKDRQESKYLWLLIVKVFFKTQHLSLKSFPMNNSFWSSYKAGYFFFLHFKNSVRYVGEISWLFFLFLKPCFSLPSFRYSLLRNTRHIPSILIQTTFFGPVISCPWD